jgi:4-amino-4-deoxy-L-arabinose transferase-like glycosyltransferase
MSSVSFDSEITDDERRTRLNAKIDGLGRGDKDLRPTPLLLFIVLSALLIRTLFAVLFTGEIDAEGTEYARIAQNLIAGNGYVGIATPGTELLFPPLFSFLIAGVTLIVGDAGVAGRIVSVVFGTLLAFPVYLIAGRLFGQRAALVAAALTAFHPYLIVFSVSVFGESTFLTFLMAAVYSAMYAATKPTRLALAASGALYGASYLVRPEAFIYMLVGLGCFLLSRLLFARDKLRSIAGRALLMPLLFLVVAGPYIGWLSMHAGHLRLEGKSPLNLSVELKTIRGLSDMEASFGVDQNLTEQGFYYQPNVNLFASYRFSLSDLMSLVKARAKTVVGNTGAAVAGWLSPALFALAMLGLFSRAWGPSLVLDQLHLFVLLVLSILATFFIYSAPLRYYLLVLVLFSIWACAAKDGLKLWAQRSASLCGLGERQQGVVAAVAWSLAIAAVILPPAVFSIHSFRYMRGTRPIKALAENMAVTREPLRFADASGTFAFNAGAQFVWLPYCDEATALQFLNKRHVTHVVARGEALEWRPYLKKWMESGVPGGSLVAQAISGTGEKVQVYELRRAGASELLHVE